MKILMLSWEYPPKNVGGLATHVYNLSHELCMLGNEVHIITCEEDTAPILENDNGVIVHRVTPYNIATEDFTKWVMHLNFAMVEEGIRIIKESGRFDIIHAHDWLVAYSAKVLKWSFNIPMASTIHATENGRNGGINNDMQRYIASAEWLLSYESWKVIGCSSYMKNQISDLFKIPENKIWIIPNGVGSKVFNIEFDPIEFRKNYAKVEEKIIFFVGRHVFEKGVQILIEGARGIIRENPNTKIVIAGQGPMTAEIKDRVFVMGLNDKFVFPGYLDEATKNKLYRVADVAVFPSLYEPFGIVALEAMAAGCPIVVSDTGGLSEIIKHKVNGLTMINGSANSLKDNVLELLKNNELANRVKENALKSVKEKYTWEMVAKLTFEMYKMIKKEAKSTQWEIKENSLVEEALSKNSKKRRHRKFKR